MGIPQLGGCDFLKYWVVELEAAVVGVTGLYVSQITPEDVAWIGWTAVDPARRGQGIGKALIKHVISEAKKMRIGTIAVYTTDAFPIAQRTYRSMGFQATRGRGRNLIFKKGIEAAPEDEDAV